MCVRARVVLWEDCKCVKTEGPNTEPLTTTHCLTTQLNHIVTAIDHWLYVSSAEDSKLMSVWKNILCHSMENLLT